MRDTEREAETQAEGGEQAPCKEPDVGLDPGNPGSRPEPRQTLSHWATQVSLQETSLNTLLST